MFFKTIITNVLFATWLQTCESHYTYHQQQCVRIMSNGCSAPCFLAIFGLKIYYKDIFVPACDRHDICYNCGTIRHWNRKECDDRFYQNMIALCDRRYGHFHRKRSAFFKWIFRKVRQGYSYLKAKTKYLLSKPGTHDRCVKAANVFYTGVRTLAGSHFHPDKKSHPYSSCFYRCAKGLGSPRKKIHAR